MEEDLSLEELKELEEESFDLDKNAFEVNDGICKDCGGRLIKIVENRNILDGAITFHIIKLKCQNCGKEYLDLNQAEKYDFALLLERAVRQPLDKLSRRISTNN